MSNTKERPILGVGVLVFKDKCILLGKRLKNHYSGTWQPPGGYLEFGESIEHCAQRELFEETGLEAKTFWSGNATYGFYTYNERGVIDKHYVSTFEIVCEFSGDLINKEPDKCEGWHWFDIEHLPSPLFPSFGTLVKTKTWNKYIVPTILKSKGETSPFLDKDK